MKIVKIDEKNYGAIISKNYMIGEQIKTTDLVLNFINNGINVNYVFVKENVDVDSKTIEGAYDVQAFVNEYEYLKNNGEDLSFQINIDYNDINLDVTTYDNSRMINIITSDDSVELENLLEKKSEKLL